MAAVTLTQIDSPSRSKMGGPCWVAIDDIYAATNPRELSGYQAGDTLKVTGKATLKRVSGRSDIERKEWRLIVTDNPEDSVTVRVGTPQAVVAVITGVKDAG